MWDKVERRCSAARHGGGPFVSFGTTRRLGRAPQSVLNEVVIEVKRGHADGRCGEVYRSPSAACFRRSCGTVNLGPPSPNDRKASDLGTMICQGKFQ